MLHKRLMDSQCGVHGRQQMLPAPTGPRAVSLHEHGRSCANGNIHQHHRKPHRKQCSRRSITHAAMAFTAGTPHRDLWGEFADLTSKHSPDTVYVFRDRSGVYHHLGSFNFCGGWHTRRDGYSGHPCTTCVLSLYETRSDKIGKTSLHDCCDHMVFYLISTDRRHQLYFRLRAAVFPPHGMISPWGRMCSFLCCIGCNP